MGKDNEKEEKSQEIKDTKKACNDRKLTNDGNELLQFFIGIALLGVGLFMLSKRVMVHGSWHVWRIGGFDLASGTVTIPLIIGVIWFFYNPKSVIPKIIITLSVIFIIVTIIMSVRINFVTTSLFDYILIFVLAAAGAGLLLKTLFKKKA